MVRRMIKRMIDQERLRRAAKRHVQAMQEQGPGPDPRDAAAFDAVWDALGQAELGDEERDGAAVGPLRNRIAIAGIGAFAAAAAAAVLLFPLYSEPDMIEYETAPGEQRMIRLADGSLVTLNTGTAISAEIGDRGRRVTMERGEAFFDIAADPDAPFTATWGQAQAQVLGTRFNMRVDRGGVEVDVLEGEVAVGRINGDSLSLTAGQAAGLRSDGLVSSRREAQTERVAAWREGRVLFDATPLHEAVEEMNRYSTTPLVIESQSLSELAISGRFRAGSSMEFAQALEITHPIEARRVGSSIRLRETREAATPQGRFR